MDTPLRDRIVYEDNHIVVVNKLPSEIVQGDKTGDVPLSENVKEFIRERDHKPGNVFCGVVHRLDRPVSGLVIFAKTSKGLSRFSELFRSRQLSKKYLAVVENRPAQAEALLTHYLVKNEKTNTSRVVSSDHNGASEAKLKYKLVAQSDRYFLLAVELMTGRHHQIRCQLSAIGCPVKGDVKYGARRANSGGFIHLHSFQLIFDHPVKKITVDLKAWPAFTDPLWDYFKKSYADNALLP